MTATTYFLVVLIVLHLFPERGNSTSDVETSLRAFLRSGYDQDVRPGTPTDLYTMNNIRSLVELDIATETMETVGWYTMIWNDPRLVWDSTSYSGIAALEIDWTWRPKFIITNRVDKLELLGQDDTVVRVYANGNVRWLLPIMITTSCAVDITLFPFDTQTCEIENLFWNSADTEINIIMIRNDTDLTSFLENGEWDVKNTTSEKKLLELGETVPAIFHYFTFERKRPYYVINLLLPALLMSVCIIWTFLLPVDSGERIGYAITIMLTYTVLMTITNDFLPSTSSQTPHIASYLLIVLIFSLAAVALSVLTVKLYFMEGEPPMFLQKIFYVIRMAVFCRCKRAKKDRSVTPQNLPTGINYEDTKDNQIVLLKGMKSALPEPSLKETDSTAGHGADSEVKAPGVTWKNISETMDRICFFLYFAGIGIYDIILLAALQGNGIAEVQF